MALNRQTPYRGLLVLCRKRALKGTTSREMGGRGRNRKWEYFWGAIFSSSTKLAKGKEQISERRDCAYRAIWSASPFVVNIFFLWQYRLCFVLFLCSYTGHPVMFMFYNRRQKLILTRAYSGSQTLLQIKYAQLCPNYAQNMNKINVLLFSVPCLCVCLALIINFPPIDLLS